MTTVQPRERAVPCGWCWPRTRRTTWNTTAVCDDCTRLANLVERPTQITETVWGPRLPADSCTPRWSDLFGIDPNFTTADMTEADTEAAYARWCRDHTGGDAA